ncbi:hypothetical protein ES708_28271 [subsurface metagenome]
MTFVILLGIVWYLNPSTTAWVGGWVFPIRYIIAYRERLWWADFIGKGSDGRPYFVLCSPTGALRMTERQNVRLSGELLDMWTLGGSWVQSYSSLLLYKEWRWDTVFVDFVGYCFMSGEYVWCLKEPYVDSWQSEAPPGYVHPPHLRCKAWGELP